MVMTIGRSGETGFMGATGCRRPQIAVGRFSHRVHNLRINASDWRICPSRIRNGVASIPDAFDCLYDNVNRVPNIFWKGGQTSHGNKIRIGIPMDAVRIHNRVGCNIALCRHNGLLIAESLGIPSIDDSGLAWHRGGERRTHLPRHIAERSWGFRRNCAICPVPFCQLWLESIRYGMGIYAWGYIPGCI